MTTTKHIILDPTGALARLAAWEGARRAEPVAGVALADAEPAFFVADEVLLAPDARDMVEAFTRLGAEVAPEIPTPPAPREVRRRRSAPDRLPPAPIVMRFAKPISGEALREGLRLLDERAASTGKTLAVTSPEAAAVAGHVFARAAEGAGVMLNWLGRGAALPLRTEADDALPAFGAMGGNTNPGPGDNAFRWAAFRGPARVIEAWQLVESFDRLRVVDRNVLLAILDGGFWLDGNGVPLSNPDTDFGADILQVDLIAGALSAGGQNAATCASGACPWHGNAVASVAVGAVDNDFGAAGVGGTVARPVLLRTSLTVEQILRGVRLCVDWRVDVLNMSFSMGPDDNIYALLANGRLFLTTWRETFQFAADSGVVMIACAANNNTSICDAQMVRPACDTPGVLSVGALNPDGLTRWNRSNFGPGVALWAPGVNLPVGPDGNNPAWTVFTGTSAAAPFVAGVAAMIRAVNPGLGAEQVRQLLLDTAWGGEGPVTLGLDAYAAVLEAIGGRLPKDALDPEAGPSPVTPLFEAPGRAGLVLAPPTERLAISASDDVDLFRFVIDAPARINLGILWYGRLARLSATIEAEDPSNADPVDLVETRGDGALNLVGQLSAGAYRIRVRGDGPTAYELRLRRDRFVIARDPNEPNDSFEQATCIEFRPSGPFEPSFLRRGCLRPGLHSATLHRTFLRQSPTGPELVDTDFYVFTGPSGLARSVPVIEVLDADAPVDVTLFDDQRQVVRTWKGVSRNQTARIVPVEGNRAWLRVSGDQPTSYRVSVRLELDRSVPPAAFPPVHFVPQWWGRPEPLTLRQQTEIFAVDLESDLTRLEGLSFEVLGAGPVTLRLLDLLGGFVGVGARTEGAQQVERLNLATAALDQGVYLLEVRREQPEVRAGRPPALRPTRPDTSMHTMHCTA